MTVVTSKNQSLVLQITSDLARHEGFREYAYPDPLSKMGQRYRHLPWGFKPARELLPQVQNLSEADGSPWTVGFGFTNGVTPDSRMARQIAERKLEELVLKMIGYLTDKLSWFGCASFVTKTVLVNMAFNMGTAGLFSFKNTLRFIEQKNYAKAASNMKLSRWYGQVGDRAKELVARMATQTIEAVHKAPEKL